MRAANARPNRTGLHAVLTGKLITSITLLSLVAVTPARGADPSEVLLVVNDTNTISQAIGTYYAGVRAIPSENVFHLAPGTSDAETISRTTFNTQVRDPILQYLSVTKPHLKDQVRYLVLTKGVPLRISDAPEAYASLESELCLLFTPLLGDVGQSGWVNNPYYAKDQTFKSFSHVGIKYLACRLDGYEVPLDTATGVPTDVKGLIDRAQSPAAAGTFLLDQDSSKSGAYAQGNQWMTSAQATLLQLSQSVTLEPTTTFASNVAPILGYASWGSNDCCTAGAPYYGEVPIGSGNVYPGVFANGALATTYVSTSGRTFLTSQATYGQSLIADLIRLGASGANGHVYEPYLTAIARPQLLFPRYLAGYDAIEAFYMSIPYLSWQNTVVVDPLMKSAIVAVIPPKITFVSPAFGKHEGGTTVVIVGTDLGGPGDTVAVRFGGVLAPSAQFLGQNYLVVTTPPSNPGPVDLVVEVFQASAAAPTPFVFRPAMTGATTASIGQTAALQVEGAIGDAFIVFLGSTPTSLAAPPHGTLLLDPTALFIPVLQLPFASGFSTMPLQFQVPNDASLIGLVARFQAIVGDLQAGSPQTYFTNRLDLTLQP